VSLTENELTLDLWESVEIVVVLGVDPKVITEWWPDRFRDLNLGIFVVGSLTHFIFSGLVGGPGPKIFQDNPAWKRFLVLLNKRSLRAARLTRFRY
jgi:hypothetical protein